MYALLLGFRFLAFRRITYVSMGGIWIGVTALVVVMSVMNGFLEETKRKVRGTTADIVITPIPDTSAEGVSPRFEELEPLLRSIPNVAGVAPHLNRFSLVGAKGTSPVTFGWSKFADLNAALVIGVDLAREEAATDFEEYLRHVDPGKGAAVDDPANPFAIADAEDPIPRDCVLVGEWLFHTLSLHKGQTITLVTYRFTEDGDFAPLYGKFTVCGTFSSGQYEYDIGTIYISMEAAKEFMDDADGISEICVKLGDYTKAPETQRRIQDVIRGASLGNWPVETWEERKALLLGAIDNERHILGFILFFIVLVASFNIYSTLSVMVTDKFRDIGVLSALGARPGGIAALFLTSGVSIAGLGCLLGLFSGLLVCWNLSAIESFLRERFGFEIFRPDIYIFDRLPVSIDLGQITILLVATLAASVCFSVFPAVRASRFDPVRALRYE